MTVAREASNPKYFGHYLWIAPEESVEQDLGGLPGDGGGDLPHRDGPGQAVPRLPRVRPPPTRRALSSWRAAYYCAAPKRRFLTVPC